MKIAVGIFTNCQKFDFPLRLMLALVHQTGTLETPSNGLLCLGHAMDLCSAALGPPRRWAEALQGYEEAKVPVCG